MSNIFSRVIGWNAERLNLSFNHQNEYDMLMEELGVEFKDAKNEDEMVDALCDIIVVATGALYKLGYSPELTMDETLKEIESRMQDPDQAEQWDWYGVPEGAKWQKWKEQPKNTLYKADYSKCKYSANDAELKEIKEELRQTLLEETHLS